MRKGWLLLIVLALWVTAGLTARAQAPVTINRSEFYVVVLQDGRLDIRYSLTFTEHEGRDRIREIGPFGAGHRLIAAAGEGPDGAFAVDLEPAGNQTYAAVFEHPTYPGGQYTVTIRYAIDRPAFDATAVDGKPYRALAWAPFQWSLPIEEAVLQFIFPIELPAEVDQPEEVTDALVDASGLVVGDIATFDRWVYFPTPDKASGKNWLSLYLLRRNLPANEPLRPIFYLPASAVPGTAETSIPLGQTGVPTVAPQPTAQVIRLTEKEVCPAVGVICGAVGVVAALVTTLVVLLVRRRRPQVYEPPEIEIETFETPGVVPDLEAVEAAFYLGNSAKTIALIVLGLEQQGVVTVLNRHPLQLEVTRPNADLKPYEKALIDAILPDGTLDQSQVTRIMEAVAAAVRPKIWNADPAATRESYERRIREAQADYEREWRERRRPMTWPEVARRPYAPWVIIGHAPTGGTGRPSTESQAGPSPLAQAAEEAVRPLESFAGEVTQGIERSLSRVAQQVESGVDRLFGRQGASGEQAGYDACHSACLSACHSACVH